MDPDFNRSTRSRLHPALKEWFPGDTLHDRIARALCEARCLPRKEFFESWSFLQKVRRHLDAKVVWDVCAGHGLVAMLLALLEPDLERVVAIDKRRPQNHDKLRAALAPVDRDGRLAKVVYDERAVEDVPPPEVPVFVVAVHACGRRTDRAIDLALASRSSIALLPCCHDAADLADSIPNAALVRLGKREAVDTTRIFRLHAAGYRTLAKKVDPEVTHCADLILGLRPTPNA